MTLLFTSGVALKLTFPLAAKNFSKECMMIMINNGKTWATRGLEKPHRHNRELGSITRWFLSMSGMQIAGGEVKSLGS